MVMADYMPRIADQELNKRLSRTGAVVIEGPKACGKTETARQLAKSEFLLDINNNAELARLAPNIALEGATPRLLDEYQVAPSLWKFDAKLTTEATTASSS